MGEAYQRQRAGDGKIWVRSQEISKVSASQRKDLSGKISVDQLPVSAPSHTVALPTVSLLQPPLRMQSSTVPCRSPVPLHSLLPQIHRPHHAGKQTTSRLLKKPPNIAWSYLLAVTSQWNCLFLVIPSRGDEEVVESLQYIGSPEGLVEELKGEVPVQISDHHSGNLKCGTPSSVTVYFLRGQGLTDPTSPLQTGVRNFYCKTFRGLNLHGCARSAVL
jgi:hypothetical protein